MTSLKLMLSSTSRNSDPRRKSSDVSYSSSSTKQPDFENNNILDQQNSNNGSNSSSTLDANIMALDGYLRNVYGDSPARESSTLLNADISLLDAAGAIKAIGVEESSEAVMAPARSRKTVDDVWREIVEGKRKQCKEEAMDEMMTLEDFLVKAGAVEEEEVGARAGLALGEVKVEVGTERSSGGIFAFDSHSPYMGTPQQSMEVVVGFGNGMDVIGGGRGKRKAILEPLDKAALQRQRRMIKNRESAARSRERKQAYQVELESIAVRLEEENEQLLKEKAERTRERYKQLMEKVIPVVEKRRPRHVLRRVRSMQW